MNVNDHPTYQHYDEILSLSPRGLPSRLQRHLGIQAGWTDDLCVLPYKCQRAVLCVAICRYSGRPA